MMNKVSMICEKIRYHYSMNYRDLVRLTPRQARMVLKEAAWYTTIASYPELTLEFMRYDCGRNPKVLIPRFARWAATDEGKCPYSVYYRRAMSRAIIHFSPCRDLWRRYGYAPPLCAKDLLIFALMRTGLVSSKMVKGA